MSQILKELGRGSFGVVYLLQLPNSAKFALKVIHQKHADDDVFKEAEILSKHCHSHLVKCFTFFKMRSFIYLITEYCHQGTLKEYISKQNKYISEKTVLKMLCQLSDVLRYLHVNNIIHRDLKPANIFLDKQRHVKVGDVGVARQLDHTSEEASSLAGTLFYMSPEIRAGEKYTSKTDIWSLGCCVHEMMTLNRTFHSLKEMYSMDIPSMPQDVYSKQLQTLVLHMLREEPDTRPDAYDVLQQACEIRGKHYKSGNVRPNIDVMVEPREICRIVARFEDYASNSSWTSERDVSVPGQEENAEYEEMVENGTSTSRSKNETGSHLASQESCLNLERDPFGILPKSKSNSCRSAHRSQTSYSSQGYEDLESLASDLTVQEDYTDNAFPSIGSGNTDLHQGVNCVFDGDESSEESIPTQSAQALADDKSARMSDSDDSVTLYTRAQHAKYINRPKQDTGHMSTSDLARSTANVFAEQSDSLKKLMMRRVVGHDNYEVDGKPMLSHQPF
ncbi:hypothetical protein RRG08_015003 [Elysia crispata]|uniref:non-specific serine/threonine protein kinase n=1 Tax=Elysia crispata TaxID=231223 RepID=A0AAE1B0X7_9GAST|nr:hypothetical protein RRG08_015003 [Elysia crispata]